MEQNQIIIEKRGPVTLLDIKGDVTSSSERTFIETYGALLDPGNTETILLKFEENAYIDSGGIAVLIQLLAESRGKKQKVGIIGLSDHLKNTFKMLGINKFAGIYPSVEEAVQNLWN